MVPTGAPTYSPTGSPTQSWWTENADEIIFTAVAVVSVAIIVALVILWFLRKQCYDVLCRRRQKRCCGCPPCAEIPNRFRTGCSNIAHRFRTGCSNIADDLAGCWRRCWRRCCTMLCPRPCLYCYPPETTYGDVSRYSNVGVVLWGLKKVGLHSYFTVEEEDGAEHIECCYGCVKGDAPDVLQLGSSVSGLRDARGAHRQFVRTAKLPAQYYWDNRNADANASRAYAPDIAGLIVLLDYDLNAADDGETFDAEIQGVALNPGKQMWGSGQLAPGKYGRRGSKIVPIPDGTLANRKVFLTGEVDFFSNADGFGSGAVRSGHPGAAGISSGMSPPSTTARSAGLYLQTGTDVTPATFGSMDDSVVVLDVELYGDDAGCCNSGGGSRLRRRGGPVRGMRFEPGAREGFRPGLYARGRDGDLVAVPDGYHNELFSQNAVVVANWIEAVTSVVPDPSSPDTDVVGQQFGSVVVGHQPQWQKRGSGGPGKKQFKLPPAFFGRRGPMMVPLKDSDVSDNTIVLDVDLKALDRVDKIHGDMIKWKGKGKPPRFCAWVGDELVPVSTARMTNKMVIVPWQEKNGLGPDALYTLSSKMQRRRSKKAAKQPNLAEAYLPPQFFWEDRKTRSKSHGKTSSGSRTNTPVNASKQELESSVVLLDYDLDADEDDDAAETVVKGVALTAGSSKLAVGTYVKHGGRIVPLPDGALDNRRVFLTGAAEFWSYMASMDNQTSDQPGGSKPSKPKPKLLPGLFLQVGQASTDVIPTTFDNMKESVILLDVELYGDDAGAGCCSSGGGQKRRGRGPVRGMRFEPGASEGFKPGLYGRGRDGSIVPVPDGFDSRVFSSNAVVLTDWHNGAVKWDTDSFGGFDEDDESSDAGADATDGPGKPPGSPLEGFGFDFDDTSGGFNSIDSVNASTGYGFDPADLEAAGPGSVRGKRRKRGGRQLPPAFYAYDGFSSTPLPYKDLGNDVVVLDIDLSAFTTTDKIHAERIAWDGQGDTPRYCIWQDDELVPISAEHLTDKTVVVPWQGTPALAPTELSAITTKMKRRKSETQSRTQGKADIDHAYLPPQYFWDDRSDGGRPGKGSSKSVDESLWTSWRPTSVSVKEFSSSVVLLDYELDAEDGEDVTDAIVKGVAMKPGSSKLTAGIYAKKRGKIVPMPSGALNNRRVFLTGETGFFEHMDGVDWFQRLLGSPGERVDSTKPTPMQNSKTTAKKSMPTGLFKAAGTAVTPSTFPDWDDSVVVVDVELYGDEPGGLCSFKARTDKAGKDGRGVIRAIGFEPGSFNGLKPGLYARDVEGDLIPVPAEYKADVLAKNTVIVADWNAAAVTSWGPGGAFDFDDSELKKSSRSADLKLPSLYAHTGGSNFHALRQKDLNGDVVVLDIDITNLASARKIHAERIQGNREMRGEFGEVRYCIWQGDELVPISAEHLANKTLVVPWNDGSGLGPGELSTISSKVRPRRSKATGAGCDLKGMQLPPEYFYDDLGGPVRAHAGDFRNSVVFLDFDLDAETHADPTVKGVALKPGASNLAPGMYAKQGGKSVPLPDGVLTNRNVVLTGDKNLFSTMDTEMPDGLAPVGLYRKAGSNFTSTTFADMRDAVVVVDLDLYGDNGGCCGPSSTGGARRKRGQGPIQAISFNAGAAEGFKPGVYARGWDGDLALVPDSYKKRVLAKNQVVVAPWDDGIADWYADTPRTPGPGGVFDFDAIDLADARPSSSHGFKLPPVFFERDSSNKFKPLGRREMENDVIVLDIDADHLASADRVHGERVRWSKGAGTSWYCVWDGDELVPVPEEQLANKTVVMTFQDLPLKGNSPSSIANGRPARSRADLDTKKKKKKKKRSSGLNFELEFGSDDSEDSDHDGRMVFVDVGYGQARRQANRRGPGADADALTVFEESSIKQKAHVFRPGSDIAAVILPPTFFNRRGDSVEQIPSADLVGGVIVLDPAGQSAEVYTGALVDGAATSLTSGVYMNDPRGRPQPVPMERLAQKMVMLSDPADVHPQEEQPARGRRGKSKRGSKAPATVAGSALRPPPLPATFFARRGAVVAPMYKEDLEENVVILDLDLDATSNPRHDAAAQSVVKRVTAERLVTGVGLASWLEPGFYARQNGQPTALDVRKMINTTVIILADQVHRKNREKRRMSADYDGFMEKKDFDPLDNETAT